MKRKNLLLIAGLAVFTFTSSQAFAFSEEDMMEGMTLSIEKSQTSGKSYKYDNSMANAKESMTEFDFFPENNTIENRYAGDPTCPEGHHIMSEGICLNHFGKEIASR